MIPGANLLNMAFRVIAKQTVLYYQYQARAQNNIGQDITLYSPAQTIKGSFQPVPRKLYEAYGLDLQKSYFTFYAPKNILDVKRDVSGDQISFQNNRYQCESNNDWFGMDGWVGVLCVYVKEEIIDQKIFGFGSKNRNFGNGNFAQGAT